MIGIVGGTGLYELDGLTDQTLAARRLAVRRAVRRAAVRPARRAAGRVPAAPRPRPSHPAARDQLPREHRRAQARRRDQRDLGERGRLAARRAAAGHVRARRSVHRSHAAQAEDVLRHRLRRARVDGAPDVRARWPSTSRRPARELGCAVTRRGTYVVMEGPQFSSLAESRAAPPRSAAT